MSDKQTSQDPVVNQKLQDYFKKFDESLEKNRPRTPEERGRDIALRAIDKAFNRVMSKRSANRAK